MQIVLPPNHPVAQSLGDAAAASTTPFDLFTDQKELAELLVGWPAERLVATYNSLPGVKPVKALHDPNTAARKIRERVANLGQMVAPEPVAAQPETAPVKVKAAGKAKAGAQAAKGAPTKSKSGKKAPAAKSKSNNKLDKCLRRVYSTVNDQVHARAVCLGS